MWYWMSGSIGSLLFGVRIVNDKDGSRISLKTSIKRALFVIPTVLTLMIGFFSAFLDNKKQTLYDKLSDTAIITKKSMVKTDKYDVRFDPIDLYVMPLVRKLFAKIKGCSIVK